MKTEGIIYKKFLTDPHDTIHTFYVLGEPSALQYEVILGKDFLEERESVINYCSSQIIMNDEVCLNFNVKPCVNITEPCRLTLNARTENIVNIPTYYKRLGLLDKSELLPAFISPHH